LTTCVWWSGCFSFTFVRQLGYFGFVPFEILCILCHWWRASLLPQYSTCEFCDGRILLSNAINRVWKLPCFV
jgi:hypothetical protein